MIGDERLYRRVCRYYLYRYELPRVRFRAARPHQPVKNRMNLPILYST